MSCILPLDVDHSLADVQESVRPWPFYVDTLGSQTDHPNYLEDPNYLALFYALAKFISLVNDKVKRFLKRGGEKDKNSVFKFSKTCSTILFVSAVPTPGSLVADKCINLIAVLSEFHPSQKLYQQQTNFPNASQGQVSESRAVFSGDSLLLYSLYSALFTTELCVLMCQAGGTVLPTVSALALCGK